MKMGARYHEAPDEEEKKRLLETIEEFTRKVKSGELVGLIVVGIRVDDGVLAHTRGEPPGAHAILMLESVVAGAKQIFLDGWVEDDDGRPVIGVAEDSEPG